MSRRSPASTVIRTPHSDRPDTPAQALFAAIYGALLGLTLLKFGNPAILGNQIGLPTNAYEWVLAAWPIGVGWGLLAAVAILGLPVVRRPSGVPWWILVAPLPWLVWQLVSATGTVEAAVTVPTLIHLFTNALCFYLGLSGLGPIKDIRRFWIGLLTGFVLVLLSGWQQHFGGLQATREIFWSEIYPQLTDSVPAEWIKRMSSDRIFATLFYPNTLAGAILLLTPASVWGLRSVVDPGPGRRISLALVVVLAAGCLLWSGSKAGWLLTLGLGLVALLRFRFPFRLKLGLMVGVLILGFAGFAWKYSDYLRKGAPSTAARLDYWEAAVKTAGTHPILGTGPGTFGEAYAEIKRPESEMAKLTHNDFLQQASDSGWPGFILFTAFVASVLAYPAKRVWQVSSGGPFWVWLGVVGIWLQSLGEFGFYIPALSWPAMTFMGWLVATTNHLDNPNSTNLTSSSK